MKKQQKGITLIALVITIIVLLILAGVSIAMLTGDNGILTQANKAKIETRGGACEEEVRLWKTEVNMSKYEEVNSTYKTEDEMLQDLIQKELTFENEIDRNNKTITIGNRVIDYGIEENNTDNNNYTGLTTTWKVDTANETIIFPLLGNYKVEIDWGDGSDKEKFEGTDVTTGLVQPDHIYKDPGNYNISVTGEYDSFGAEVENVSYPIGELNNLVQVLSWGEHSLKSVSFANAKNLMYVAEPKNEILKDLVNCNYMFFGCDSLKTIPKGIFKDCTKVTEFTDTFSESGITNLPEGIFDNCVAATSFNNTFAYSNLINIPEELFDKCPNVTDFYGTFSNCRNVEGKAPNIYTRNNVTSHSKCFYDCSKLSNYNEIPSDWK